MNMFKIIKKEFNHTDCGTLNNKLDELVSELSNWYEALTENFMDVTLDHEKEKEKEWSELYADPHAWLDTQLLKSEREVLGEVIHKLNDIIYAEPTIIPVEDTSKRRPYLHVNNAREWLIDNVKPLIHGDVTSQTEIARRLDVNNELISSRVKTCYGVYWKDYVEGVQHGRY